jgi:hypothetical protein
MVTGHDGLTTRIWVLEGHILKVGWLKGYSIRYRIGRRLCSENMYILHSLQRLVGHPATVTPPRTSSARLAAPTPTPTPTHQPAPSQTKRNHASRPSQIPQPKKRSDDAAPLHHTIPNAASLSLTSYTRERYPEHHGSSPSIDNVAIPVLVTILNLFVRRHHSSHEQNSTEQSRIEHVVPSSSSRRQ